jgi:hypothetical protein
MDAAGSDLRDDCGCVTVAVEAARENVHRSAGKHQDGALPAVEAGNERIRRAVAGKDNEDINVAVAKLRQARHPLLDKFDPPRDRACGIGEGLFERVQGGFAVAAARGVGREPDRLALEHATTDAR